MAVAQIPNMPAMPDIQGGYAKIGEQIAGVGKQLGGMVVDFASAQGKKKLVDEIKVKYPSVVQAYPEDVLMQMDNKELGTRLAAVVGIENAIPRIKEIDPKFSTADIEQMKAEIFKQPDQARTIARDWMTIAEKNKQDSVNKESLAMVGGQPTQAPAMPQPAPRATISDADLTREANNLMEPSRPIINNTMPIENSPPLGQQLAAVDAERAPAMPAVSQKPRTRESIYSDISTAGKIPDAATQQIIDKASRSEKDLAAEEFKSLSLQQKKQLAGEAAVRKAKEFQQRMALGERNAKTNEMLVALTAINKVEDLTDAQTKIAADAMDAELSAEALRSSGGDENLAQMYDKIADQNWKRSLNMDPNVTTAQGVASGIVEEVGGKFPGVAKGASKQKAMKAWDSEAASRGQPLFKDLTPEQQKKVISRYSAAKK